MCSHSAVCLPAAALSRQPVPAQCSAETLRDHLLPEHQHRQLCQYLQVCQDTQRTGAGSLLRGILPEEHEDIAGAGVLHAADIRPQQQSAGSGHPHGPAGYADQPGEGCLYHVPGVTATGGQNIGGFLTPYPEPPCKGAEPETGLPAGSWTPEEGTAL
ncbi:hypothetical protein FKM82_005269 [Ascaphus truei]